MFFSGSWAVVCPVGVPWYILQNYFKRHKQQEKKNELMLTIVLTGSCVLFLYCFCTVFSSINENNRIKSSLGFFYLDISQKKKKKKDFKQTVDKIYVERLFLLG